MEHPSLLQKNSLCFFQLNAENLFLHLDQYKNQDLTQVTEWEWQKFSLSSVANKSLKKTFQLAQTILKADPDFVLLNEVGGEESLLNFNQYFLHNKYQPLIIEGNSDRGIDVGYLVKPDNELQYLLITHQQRPLILEDHANSDDAPILNKPPHSLGPYFSRDVLELRIFKRGEGSPRLICLLTHLKSKLDPAGEDPQGRKRRKAELKTLIKIYNEISIEMKNQVPVLIGGDFNGTAHQSACEPEFSDIYNHSDLKELFDLKGLSKNQEEERTTQVQFTRDGSRKLLQLDYFFLSPHLFSAVVPEESYVYHYDQDPQHAPNNTFLPQSLEHRLSLPSDHFPVILTLNNPLRKR